jgi:hypothetical protein
MAAALMTDDNFGARAFESTNEQGYGLLDGRVEYLYRSFTECRADISYKVSSKLTGASVGLGDCCRTISRAFIACTKALWGTWDEYSTMGDW